LDRFAEVSQIFPHFALKSRETEVKSPCFYYVCSALCNIQILVFDSRGAVHLSSVNKLHIWAYISFWCHLVTVYSFISQMKVYLLKNNILVWSNLTNTVIIVCCSEIYLITISTLPQIDPNFNVSFPATACSPTFHKNEQWS
jgi:uncharacterized membrane protein (GlpM family)